MLSWGARRQLTFFFWVVVVLSLLGGLYWYFFVRIPESCFDNVKNQNEIDVDCGGVCAKICPAEISALKNKWTRLFKIGEGRYDVAGYMINYNPFFGVPKFEYKISLFDEKNSFIVEKNGSAFINPNEETVIFETGLETGKRIPKKAILEFKEDQSWLRFPSDFKKYPLFVENENISDTAMPRLTADIANNSPIDLPNINVVAVIYDDKDNAIGASDTYIDKLSKESKTLVSFTWPSQFEARPKRVDIFPRIDYAKTIVK